MQRTLIFFCLFLVGCDNDAPPVEKITPTAPVAPKERDPALRFTEKIEAFLTEARAGARLLIIGASVKQIGDKSEQITDLYAHLPDVPSDLDDSESIASSLKRIDAQFSLALEYSKALAEGQQIGSDKITKTAAEQLLKISNEIKQLSDSIERQVKGTRPD